MAACQRIEAALTRNFIAISIVKNLFGKVLRGVFFGPKILDLILPIFNERETKDATPSPEMNSAQAGAILLHR